MNSYQTLIWRISTKVNSNKSKFALCPQKQVLAKWKVPWVELYPQIFLSAEASFISSLLSTGWVKIFFILMRNKKFPIPMMRETIFFFVSGNYFPWTREPCLMLLFKNNSFIWTLDYSKTYYLKQFICFPFLFFLLMITQAVISNYFHVPGCLISSDDSKILCQGIYCNTEQK